MFNLSSLVILDVGYNQIQGSLPWNIGITLPNLEYLAIELNQFAGSIPISISNVSNLIIVDLSENELSGKVPSLEKLYKMTVFGIDGNNLGNGGANDLSFLCSLTNATYLAYLDVDTNQFGGELPKCIGNFSTTLNTFTLENNKISKNIPTEIGNLINLEELNIAWNKLSGNIPSEIRKLQKLKILSLNTNNFYGSIPSSIGNLTPLIKLNLYENNLQGNIPLSLSKCQNLISLDLANNNLIGLLSPIIIGLPF